MTIRFNSPYSTGNELEYISEALEEGKLAGNGPFTKRCQALLETEYRASKVLLTHSCTAALEMAAILADIGPGDEVIMPSFTFVSTANAFVLRGAKPVFVDIRRDTLNLDETKVEAAITPNTRAIVPVHYAGVSCNMDALNDIANRHNLLLIADAAQAVGSYYKERPTPSYGQLSTLSFHETKNVISGEGGALIINDESFSERAEIIWEKGTNRAQFFRGEIDKYTWVDVGSSFLPGELTAAFLLAQLEQTKQITEYRQEVWDAYHNGLEELEKQGHLRRPIIPGDVQHNAHMYYILLPTAEEQEELLRRMREANIGAVFHYIPLHSTVAGKKFGRAADNLPITDDISARLVRLPLWPRLGNIDIERSINLITTCLG